jgi:hypothetical protein
MLRKAGAGHLKVAGNIRNSWLVALFAVGSAAVCVAAVASPASDDEQLIGRVVKAVELHYRRTQTLVATETTTIQPLTHTMKNQGRARTVINDVRFEWGGSDASPRTIRQLLNADGPSLPDACHEPRSESHDRLEILLQPRRNLRLTVRGTDAIAGVPVQRIDFDLITTDAPRAEWKDNCGRVQAGAWTRGRVWVDPATGEVLRLSEGLVRSVKIPGPPRSDGRAPQDFTIRRVDTTVDFARYVFTDPDERLLLPSRVDRVLVVTNASVPRVRTTMTFTNYRRYLTSGRVVPE